MDHDDQVERLVRELFGTGYTVTGGPVWLTVTPDRLELPEDGWKLHVSSRAATLPVLAGTLLPLLLAEGCAFKLVRSQCALDELNDGVTSPANVGKACTVYPDQDRVRELGLRLAEATRGHQGPRVLSDRRVSAGAPVYYRFGPFATKRAPDARGRLVTSVTGPGGEEAEAIATLRYRQPAWAVDPFTGEKGDASIGEPEPVIGGRYRVVAGIREAAQGNVFRAIDLRHDATVAIKQARALVAEHGERNDARLRLRNERRVLLALDRVAGVPRFIDHFRHGGDEFLVTSYCEGETLDENVRRRGTYDDHNLSLLAAGLAKIVSALDDRDVVMRDLSPKNIIVDGERVSVVDFAIAYHNGLHLPGGTPGYAPARQFRDEPPRDTDDLHALGLTLWFAASGLHPVDPGDDDDRPRRRALEAIGSACGPEPSGLIAVIADLLSDDEALARKAFDQLAGDHKTWRTARPLPAVPVVTAELAGDLAGSLLRDLVGQARDILRAPESSVAANDISIYSGTAGIGLELLAHGDREGAADCASELVRFTAAVARRGNFAAGLFSGVTGVHVFLREAGGTADFTPDIPEGDDLIDGAAGVGLGHLYLHRVTGDPAHLQVAARCAQQVMTRPPPAPRPARPVVGIDGGLGRAHGLAGIAALLLSFAEATADPAALEAAARCAGQVAARTRSLLSEAGRPSAARMSVSWCQGLAGIGQTLLHGSAVLGDPGLFALTREAADVCVSQVRRMGTLGQCCGAAGVGNFLMNVAARDNDERYLAAAYDVAAHLLLRNSGTITRPDFGAGTPDEYIASWAAGLTGLVAFFRRLAGRGGPTLPAPLA